MPQRDYYVYVYIDPRDYKPFYYGKGRGSRSQAHLFQYDQSEKCKRIRSIEKAGLAPTIRVLAYNLTEEQALLIETTLIWQSKELITNKIGGRFSKNFRPALTLYKEIVGVDYHHRLWYFNVGDGSHRKWEDNIKYGYVGAGQKSVFRGAVEGLSAGDVIAAYLSQLGYVGVGKIIGQARPAREFRLKDGNLLIEKKGLAPKIRENLASLDDCEWMAPVKWVATVSRENAFFEKKSGIFASRTVRASLAHQPETIKFIEKKFGIEDLFELTDASPTSPRFV